MILDHANNSDFEDPDEVDEDNDWETQQIRKAVTGSQLAAAQQESAGMAAMYNNIVSHSIAIQEQQTMIPLMNQKPRFSDAYVPQGLMSTIDPDDIINKTKEMYLYHNVISYMFINLILFNIMNLL